MPHQGMRSKDSWVPVGCGTGCTNQWVNIGNDNPTTRLCKTYKDVFGSKPTTLPAHSEVYCCTSKGVSGSNKDKEHDLTFRVRVRTQIHLAIDSRAYDGASSDSDSYCYYCCVCAYPSQTDQQGCCQRRYVLYYTYSSYYIM